MRYIFTLLIFFLPFNVALAELSLGFTGVEVLSQPEYPKPSDTVNLTIQSYSQDLQGADIKWLLADGVILKEGRGATKLTITAPLLGESLNISIQVNDVPVAGHTILPTTVDILWEAQTYTPKQYLGRALPVNSSKIIAAAIPHLGTGKLTENDLIYNWSIGSKSLTKNSGRGVDTITITAPGLYDDYNLSVTVTGRNGQVLAQNGVRITSIEPELVLYRLSPLLGMNMRQALTNNTKIVESSENSLVVIPYYFNIETPQELTYTWGILGAKLLQGATTNIITVANAQKGAKVSLTAQHPKILLQSAQTTYQFPKNSPYTMDSEQVGAYESPFGTIK